MPISPPLSLSSPPSPFLFHPQAMRGVSVLADAFLGLSPSPAALSQGPPLGPAVSQGSFSSTGGHVTPSSTSGSQSGSATAVAPATLLATADKSPQAQRKPKSVSTSSLSEKASESDRSLVVSARCFTAQLSTKGKILKLGKKLKTENSCLDTRKTSFKLLYELRFLGPGYKSTDRETDIYYKSMY